MMTYMSRADAPSIAPTQPERKSEGAHGASARAPMKGPSDAQREELGRLHPSPELVKFYRDRVNDFERERDGDPGNDRDARRGQHVSVPHLHPPHHRGAR